MSRVIGLDAHKKGWVGVILENGQFSKAVNFRAFEEVVADCADMAVIAVDIPIGLSDDDFRPTDQLAKNFVGGRRGSVFPVPPYPAMAAPSYPKAQECCRRLTGRGMSKQSYSLRTRIFEVEPFAAEDSRVIEVHPEVSFRSMAARPLSYGKRTWGGVAERRRLLHDAGVRLPDDLGEGVNRVGFDDLFDAAAAAWSADRRARGVGACLSGGEPSSGNGCGVISY
jgi:predicted RNase H-like nuclease